MCQVVIRSFRATADFAGFLPWRCGDPAVVLVEGILGRQAWLAASTAAQRSVREPAFDSRPVAERSPDWLIRGARPA